MILRCYLKKNLFGKILQNSQEYVPGFYFLLKKRLDKVFSFKFWEFYQNVLHTERLKVTTSEQQNNGW